MARIPDSEHTERTLIFPEFREFFSKFSKFPQFFVEILGKNLKISEKILKTPKIFRVPPISAPCQLSENYPEWIWFWFFHRNYPEPLFGFGKKSRILTLQKCGRCHFSRCCRERPEVVKRECQSRTKYVPRLSSSERTSYEVVRVRPTKFFFTSSYEFVRRSSFSRRPHVPATRFQDCFKAPARLGNVRAWSRSLKWTPSVSKTTMLGPTGASLHPPPSRASTLHPEGWRASLTTDGPCKGYFL